MQVSKTSDPIGKAIQWYARHRKPADIIVESDICEDDIIPLEVLFRSYDEMPQLEKIALSHCSGHVLDIGAGAGIHSAFLKEKGLRVTALDVSPGAVEHLRTMGIQAQCASFYDWEGPKYDTLLMLMNGLGMAGSLANLENMLSHVKNIMKPNGRLLCDSSDIRYLYEEEDGSLWIDLNTEYHGNFKFRMRFQKERGEWFEWLYVDFDSLFNAAEAVGLKARRIFEENDHYLAEITWK